MTVEYATYESPPKTIVCRDPATLEPLGEVEVMDKGEVLRRVARARDAQLLWSKTTFAERRRVMQTLLDNVLAEQERICEITVRDSGKTLVDAMLGEVVPVCEKLRYVIRHGERDLRPEGRGPGLFLHKKAWVEYAPLGVIGVICPWNFPFHNLLCPIIPALFAGNAVVSKVSEFTSWSAEPFVALVHRALEANGHSPELVQIVTGWGETGRALITSGVDKVFFTGSPTTGRKVMEAASAGPTEVVLELGGKDAMIVCDDADLDRAVDQAMMGVFHNSGQMCIGIERIYVHDDVYDEFLDRVLARVRTLRQGPPLDGGGTVDVGAMTMPRQLDHIEELLGDAVAKGARIVTGGGRHPSLRGHYFEPTVLVDVDHTMRIAHEEQFGPVMVVMRVRSDVEAVRLANDTAYGLGSSVFTRDAGRGRRIARQLRTGMTVINDYGVAYLIPSLPFGGVGISGFGRVHGPEGLRACCNAKAMVADRAPFGGLSIYPVQPTTYELARSATRLLYARGLSARASAVRDTLRSLVAEVRSRQASR